MSKVIKVHTDLPPPLVPQGLRALVAVSLVEGGREWPDSALMAECEGVETLEQFTTWALKIGAWAAECKQRVVLKAFSSPTSAMLCACAGPNQVGRQMSISWHCLPYAPDRPWFAVGVIWYSEDGAPPLELQAFLATIEGAKK